MIRKVIIAILFALFFAFRGQAQGPVKVYMPAIITSDVDNNFRIIQPLASTNEVLNPSAETTGNFSAVATATVARSTDFQKYGLFSYRVQPVTSGDGIELDLSTLTNAPHFVTLPVRGDFTSLRASLNSNLRPLTLIEKIDNNWGLYGASFGASLASGATTVEITDTASGDFYIDGIQVEPQTVWTTYIDGTQEGCAWLGIPHAAASERSGESRAGGISYDFWEQYKFQVQKIVGAGASSHNLSIDSYAVLPGGELNSDKIESRDFNIIGKFITNSEEELHEKRQELEAAFQTDDNQLTRIRFNGSAVQKEIAIRYSGGLEGDLAAFYGNIEIVQDDLYMDRELFTEKTSVQVIAPNPYWQEVGESAAILDTNDSATFRVVAARFKDTGQWDNLGPPDGVGTYTRVRAFAEDDTYIYVGGNFLNFDNIANADGIVRWHKRNQSWSALGTGVSGGTGVVWGLGIGSNGLLYVTGSFTTAGGGAAANIASWDPSSESWSALGSGLNSTGQALVVGLDGLVYVGGVFGTAGGGGASNVASWNPDTSTWSALGAGVDDEVLAITVDKKGLVYVGGLFLNAGGSNANRIASWNPDTSTWAELTSFGANNVVHSLAIGLDGVTLYVGGDFTAAGGNSINRIASWNSTGFSALGDGMDDTVRALAIGKDGILYAGGDFTTAGDIASLDSVARWNNSVWAYLDIDLPGNANVNAILASKFADPVVEQNYDLWLGYDTDGTANFAGLVTANNEGSVQAFPKIVYARSGGTSAIIETLKNERTGKELLFDYSLLDGETLEIDLEPTQKSIISSFSDLRMDAVLANSDFGIWALPRGNSDVTSFVDVAGGPTITAFMQWRDAYSGYD